MTGFGTHFLELMRIQNISFVPQSLVPLDAVLRMTGVVSVWLAFDMLRPLAAAIAALTPNAAIQADNTDAAIIEKDEGHEDTQTIKRFQLFMESSEGTNDGVVMLQCKNSVHDTSPFLCAHVETLQHSNFDSSEQQREILLLNGQKDDASHAELQLQLRCQVGITMAHASAEAEGHAEYPPLPALPDFQVAVAEEKEEEEEAKKAFDTDTIQQVSLPFPCLGLFIAFSFSAFTTLDFLFVLIRIQTATKNGN